LLLFDDEAAPFLTGALPPSDFGDADVVEDDAAEVGEELFEAVVVVVVTTSEQRHQLKMRCNKYARGVVIGCREKGKFFGV
jgi:hypothetical protein